MKLTEAADGGNNFGKLDLTPLRLSSYVDISKQLLLQNGMGAQQAIVADLGRAAGAKIDAAMFAAANVTSAPGAIAATTGVLRLLRLLLMLQMHLFTMTLCLLNLL